MPESFQQFIENRRKFLTGDAAERRLSLIETEAMSIAHRELSNAYRVAGSFFPREKLTVEGLLQVQNMLASLYGLAFRELVARGEIEPPVHTVPAGEPAPKSDTGN